MLPPKATLFDRSGNDETYRSVPVAAAALRLWTSTQSTRPVPAKCTSLRRGGAGASAGIAEELAVPGVGVAKRNHSVPPAGFHPAERPSTLMVKLCCSCRVVPSG